MTTRQRRAVAGGWDELARRVGLGSEHHDLGPDRQVVVVVPGTADVQVDAAMRRRVRLPPWKAIPPGAKNTAYGIGSWYSVLM